MALAHFGGQPAAESPDAVGARQLPGATSTAPAAALDLEAALPRWRRPSLIEARRRDRVRDLPPAPSLVFDVLPEGVAGTAERRLVRYALAPLLDMPDELRGGTISELAAGDEVLIVDRSGAYWLVDCPDGRRGWIHRTTLGALVPPG
ncbi:MAG: hypothetical protein ACHQ15_03695 [Candidatus Limnocylindrales bacterium]